MKTLLIAAIAIAPMPALAQTQAAIDARFATMDANRDGRIDKTEFSRFEGAKTARQTRELDDAFRVLDKDGDGKMTKAEAAAVPVIASNFDALDFNKDGTLSNAEMRTALAQAQALEAAK